MVDRFSNIKTLNSGGSFMRTIGKISSVLVSQDNRFGAMGTYELDIEIDMQMLEQDPDKWGYVRTCISIHLAGCAANSGIPLGERAWRVSIEPWFQRLFPQLPAEFPA